jgi:hypothetical protein
MVVGALGLVGALWGLVSPTEDITPQLNQHPELPEAWRHALLFLASRTGKLLNLFPLVIYGLTVFGGWKMRKLESLGLAITASILVMFPCQMCCCLGLPVGIWSLVVLSKPEVKAAFRRAP